MKYKRKNLLDQNVSSILMGVIDLGRARVEGWEESDPDEDAVTIGKISPKNPDHGLYYPDEVTKLLQSYGFSLSRAKIGQMLNNEGLLSERDIGRNTKQFRRHTGRPRYWVIDNKLLQIHGRTVSGEREKNPEKIGTFLDKQANYLLAAQETIGRMLKENMRLRKALAVKSNMND